jgi:hypothetical protein
MHGTCSSEARFTFTAYMHETRDTCPESFKSKFLFSLGSHLLTKERNNAQ